MIPAPITIPDRSGEPSYSPRSPNRQFSLYASRLRDDDSPVPASAFASPLPSPSIPQQTISLPPSPRVHIVPFGFAYRSPNESSESLPLSQLPPLPMSPMVPMSPRWDSLSYGSRFVLQPTSESPNPASPMDAPPHPPSPFAYDAYSIPSESRNASPTFALATQLSLGDLRASENPSPSTAIGNFSRPRKLSIRQPITDPAKPRPTPGSFNPADQYLELVSSPTQNPLWPPTRPRGPSVSSVQSSSTYHSVLSPPASEFNEPRQPRSRPTTNATAPSPRPPLTYNNTGGPASPSAVAAPWMGGEELRSSFRSQLTESTAPGTTATERSSVLTKDSSVTSLYPPADADIEDDGQGEADVDDDDDELSLDDLMGMYEKGFDDDDELNIDYPVEDRPDTSASQIDYHIGARPETAASYNIGSRPATSTSDRDYSIGARRETSTSIDYHVDRPDTAASHIDYKTGLRPETAASDYNVGARPGTLTSDRDYHFGVRPGSSASSQGYNSARPDTSNSVRDFDMGARPTTSVSDMEPRHSFIQIQIDDEDDEDFPRRGENEKTSTLDREIRMSKMIFTSPAYIASVPHIAENLARRSMDKRELDKRDSAKSMDSEPSVISQRTPLSEAAPPFSPSITEITSPISPPISPPIGDTKPSLPLPSAEKAASSLISPPVSPPPGVPSNMAPPIAPAPPEDPSCRDRYGFKKENQYVNRQQYDTWNAGYTEYLARRRKKWVGYLKDSALMTDHPNRFPAPNAKTKRFVRKGIPPDWRGAAWFYYAGGPAILAQHSGLYDKLTTKKATEVDSEAIERDLHRTFPDNVKYKPPGGFQAASASARESQSTMTDDSVRGHSPVPPAGSEDEPPIITSLRRVLHAFSVYNPRIGYCQSLNFLAGLLLLFVETEEQVFWLLNVITRIYLPGTHETSLEGSKVDLGVLMTELRDTMPGIWDKVGGDLEAEPTSRPQTSKSIRLPRSRRRDMNRLSTDRLPPITLCMTAWFMSCFIGTLPIETTLRVWDVFFYEGSKTLFRISLAVFKLGESEIKSVSDPMEMFGVVQSIPRRLIDANGLMDACFKRRNGFGHLSQDQIDVRRQERRAKSQYDRAQQNKPTQTWNVTKADTSKEKEKGLFGKKRTATGL
ncbi:hypothetical protein G7Z17_g7019 [Cylindrodendrum hubeiense]|uniref:Rab-GAP TBC domain-containing protein n=1 Tax=Cylindrodendrum hubeiense TaxID=595255 RepID=A0A9P5H3Q0_9HYPO|nr:hypothetical protein G7Z17_g7019 [Cylindrodendrum hubeiense]